MIKADVKPAMLRWAVKRSRQDPTILAAKFPQLAEWQSGRVQPTLRQLEQFATATRTPIGYLFLPTPPIEPVPLPDYRTKGVFAEVAPTPDLLETVYACQQRQEWYREYVRVHGVDPVAFVGTATVKQETGPTAARMRAALRFTLADQLQAKTWEEALRRFIARLDTAGILVMVSGVVGTNNHRPLDPKEFRGFSLADPLAPLVFVNGGDSKAAQMFTLAHELAHLWLGGSSLDDVHASGPSEAVEVWCNQVAAELLVPMNEFKKQFQQKTDFRGEARRLAKVFKVSSLVALRRMAEAGVVPFSTMWTAYHEEEEQFKRTIETTGGDYYATQTTRLGKRFARALVLDTREGNTLYRDAFRLSGIAKGETFEKWGDKLGVAV